MKLRDYQEQAVRAALEAIEAGKRPVLQAPTGSGKSVIGAELCRSIIASAGGPAARPTTALSITHTRELIRQNAECFARYTAARSGSDAALRYGIYSAGLGEKNLDAPMTFAGVQSYCRLEAPPLPALILIDEAHRVPRDSATQYGKVLDAAPRAARCGLTATPYRLDSGLLIDGDDAWFDTLLPVVSTAELQASGTLSKLTGVVSRDAVSTAGVKVRAGEFVTSELEEVACDPVCVDRICRALLTHAGGRHSILVFAVSVAHAEALALRLRELKCLADVIHGGLDADTRDDRLTAFRTGRLRVLVNCMILTTGFDYPGIDCIAVVRPTMSLSLWVQMVGRGLRTAEGKTDCIEEGTMVLTDRGEIPVEQVNAYDRLWDGVEWVPHDGAVFKGYQETIEYAGLRCTREHKLWTQQGWKEAWECAKQQIPIAQTGLGGESVQLSECYFRTDNMEEIIPLRINAVCQLQKKGMEITGQCVKRKSRVQKWKETLRGETTERAISKTEQRQVALREYFRSTVQGLRRAWHKVHVRFTAFGGAMGSDKSWASTTWEDIGSHRQQWTLCAFESSLGQCNYSGKEFTKTLSQGNETLEIPGVSSKYTLCGFDSETHDRHGYDRRSNNNAVQNDIKQAKRRVWDILNAGPRRRFTANGILVSNCRVLDFGGNWARHGRSLDGLPPEAVKDEPLQDQRAREEQARSTPLAKTYRFGLDGEVDDTHETRVIDVLVRCEANRKNPALSQLRVTYLTDMGAINIWLLPEHGYGPRLHAARWFARRGIGSVPKTAHAAHALAMAAPLPESISVRRDGDFWRVVVEHFAT